MHYNDLLEEIYQRQLELSTIQGSLADMRLQIDQEATILGVSNPFTITANGQDGNSAGIGEGESSSSSSSSEAEDCNESDSSSGGTGIADKAAIKAARKAEKKAKGRTKFRGHKRGSSLELDVAWDYGVAAGSIAVAEDDE